MSSTLAPAAPPRAAPSEAETVTRSRGRLRRHDGLWALCFLGPNLLLFLGFTLLPMLFGLGVSFFDWNMIEPPRFVGLGNYLRFFTDDPLTGKVVGNSLYFVLGALPASVLIPLGLAVLLNVGVRGTRAERR